MQQVVASIGPGRETSDLGTSGYDTGTNSPAIGIIPQLIDNLPTGYWRCSDCSRNDTVWRKLWSLAVRFSMSLQAWITVP